MHSPEQVAYGAKALNYYGWGGGIYWTNDCGCIACAQMDVPGCQNQTAAQIKELAEYGQTCGCNTSQPGRPTPSYHVAKEVNADASKWGTILISGDFRFAAHFNSPGSWNADGQLKGTNSPGDSKPSTATIVTEMSEQLLATVFLKKGAQATTAYLFVVSKAVSSLQQRMAARNVTLNLHPVRSQASWCLLFVIHGSI